MSNPSTIKSEIDRNSRLAKLGTTEWRYRGFRITQRATPVTAQVEFWVAPDLYLLTTPQMPEPVAVLIPYARRISHATKHIDTAIRTVPKRMARMFSDVEPDLFDTLWGWVPVEVLGLDPHVVARVVLALAHMRAANLADRECKEQGVPEAPKACPKPSKERLFVYDRRNLMMVAIVEGPTTDAVEKRAAEAFSGDEYGSTYVAVMALQENPNVMKLFAWG